jgi:hypothetical protein
MRHVIASVLVVGCLSAQAMAAQARGAAATGKPKISACSLLSRELVEKVMTGNKTILTSVKPEEEPIGTHGSYCEYAGVGLQINPFVRHDDLRKSPGKDWQSVTGVGDTAYFRNNRNNFAELMVWTGANHFTIQLGVPTGSTAEAVRPNTITLANAIIPKLR